MIKLYPSSVAFQEGNLSFGKYSSSCHRSILLRLRGIQEPFKSVHSERGALCENEFERTLTGIPYRREVPFTLGLDSCPDLVISGRLDYELYPDSPADRHIVELKSTESSSVYADVIKRGKFKLENVAQLVTYLIASSCDNGKLIYHYYKRSKKTATLTKTDEREFRITLDEVGRIFADGTYIGFDVSNVIEHYVESYRVATTETLPIRPYAHNNFDGPCKFCPFADVCKIQEIDPSMTVDTFVTMCDQQLRGNNEQQ